jgi:hypothetical protein
MTHVSYRLSVEDKQLIERLAKYFGVSEAGVMRMIIRRVAKEEGVNQESPVKELSPVE